MAVIATLAGLMGLPRVPEGLPLRDTYLHMGLMLTALVCFSLCLLLRLEGWQALAPNTFSLLLEASGFLCLLIGSWFGGKLVYHHGVGCAD